MLVPNVISLYLFISSWMDSVAVRAGREREVYVGKREIAAANEYIDARSEDFLGMFECLLKAKKRIATKGRERERVNRQLDRWEKAGKIRGLWEPMMY